MDNGMETSEVRLFAAFCTISNNAEAKAIIFFQRGKFGQVVNEGQIKDYCKAIS
jgi:hypothetical protein